MPDRHLDERIDLDTQYVKLRIISPEEFTALERQDLDYRPDRYQAHMKSLGGEDIKDEDLLKPGEFEKLILLRGRAGIGKSTLVQSLLRRWACGIQAIHMKLILLLNLRLLMHNTRKITLATLLSLYSVYATPDAVPDKDSWFSENQCHLGIILGRKLSLIFKLTYVNFFSNHLTL